MLQFKDQHGGRGPKTLEEQHFALREKAKTNGKTLAATNLPSLSADENLESYIKGVRGSYAGLLAQEQNKIPSNQSDVADIESKSSEQRSSRMSERLNEAKNKLRKEQLDMSEMSDDDGRHRNTLFIWAGVVMVALLEAFFSYRAVGQLDQGNNITLFIILICLTVVYILVPKFLKWYFETYTAGSQYKWALNLIPIIGLGAAFYGIAILRSHYMDMEAYLNVSDAGTAAPSFTTSPWLFVSLNGLFLMCSYYLCHLLPSDEQTKNRMALEKKEAVIAKLESDIEHYETELSVAPEREKNSLIRASHHNAGRKDVYIQVNNFFKEAVGSFIEANLAYRSDGQKPRCFEGQVEDLENHFA